MTSRKLLQQAFGLTLIGLLLFGCGGEEAQPADTQTPVPTATSYPTYTPFPTMTPYPTYTPVPTPTTTGVREWLDGHFWSIKVIDVETETELDGKLPLEDIFLLVEVQWKANDLAEKHGIAGIDFVLVDDAGEQYDIAGMIYELESFDPYGPNTEFQKAKWLLNRTNGTTDRNYRLVFDVPSSAANLKLWFRNFPLIDLGLELP